MKFKSLWCCAPVTASCRLACAASSVPESRLHCSSEPPCSCCTPWQLLRLLWRPPATHTACSSMTASTDRWDDCGANMLATHSRQCESSLPVCLQHTNCELSLLVCLQHMVASVIGARQYACTMASVIGVSQYACSTQTANLNRAGSLNRGCCY